MTPSRVLVVGASAAGLATAEALRRKGYRGELTLLGAERHQPYDRPPLSKQVLAGSRAPDTTRLRSPEVLAGLHAELLLGDPAAGLDPRTRTVRTASGRAVSADAVVVATGLRPRTLPGQPDVEGVHVLRTLDDALALRAGLLAARRLVVVGEGVLGSEIAATACAMGLDVTLAGPQPTPMLAQFGPVVSGLLAALHTGHGVRLRLGHAVTGLTSARGRVSGVRLDTEEILPADVVVVAIGAEPVTGWLAGSGLRIDNGLVCDSRCRAAEGIYAVGDVAAWHHELFDAPMRLENRTNATEQALTVADNILGADRPYTPVPYFWTDQFDARIQAHGRPGPGAAVTVVDGDPASGRFTARYERDGKVTGIVGWSMPRQARLRSQEIGGPAPALEPSAPRKG
ncbi:MAG TPA: FAD-dependent oxidoreductase [Streptomyces sp.]|uniref:NAD(P)/FAD-dependent oxidoreductase n=1 Tax=Streptomyces sp. TaxID=1931 RepID=UPI002C6FB11D|nr:FAD-dependent oxidoreductase [Streptomyces sp.]HWU07748.1 FAD-dependent oxidoreductase [Streptomyces sp.]